MKQEVKAGGVEYLKGAKVLCFGTDEPHDVYPGCVDFPAFFELARQRFGIEFVSLPNKELASKIKAVKREEALPMAQDWINGARDMGLPKPVITWPAVMEPTLDDVVEQAKIYVALKAIMDEAGVRGAVVLCRLTSELPRWTAWFEKQGYLPPCVALGELLDQGYAVAGQTDVMAVVTMLLVRAAGITKPCDYKRGKVWDRERRVIRLHHCSSPFRWLGFGTPRLPYILRDYHQMGKGISAHIAFPRGAKTTYVGLTPDLKEMHIIRGTIIDDYISTADSPCTNIIDLEIKDMDAFIQKIGVKTEVYPEEHFVPGSIITGYHYEWIYGDETAALTRLCEKIGLEPILI